MRVIREERFAPSKNAMLLLIEKNRLIMPGSGRRNNRVDFGKWLLMIDETATIIALGRSPAAGTQVGFAPGQESGQCCEEKAFASRAVI